MQTIIINIDIRNLNNKIYGVNEKGYKTVKRLSN